MKAMFDFIRTEMDLLSELCLRFELENVAGPKTENSFWQANFGSVQLRHFFSLKNSKFRNFQSLLDEFGNYFSDSKYVLTLSMLHTMSMNVFLNKKEEKRNPKCDVSYIGNRSLFIQAPWAATCWTWSGAAQVLKCDKSNCLDAPHGSHKGNPPFLRVSNLE